MNTGIAAWLETLYGREPSGLLWIGGHGDKFGGRTFTSIEDAATYAAQLDAGAAGGVYHRLTTLRPIERGRGAAADSAYLPGFAMDLDIRGAGHKSDHYPPGEQDLHDLILKAGLPEPSVWVHSGGGRYPYWLLDQPADLTLPGALQDAARVARALHETVIAWAAESNWKVDNTSDLARVYRVPGTRNRKTGSAVTAYVQGEVGVRYPLAALSAALLAAARPQESDPGPADRPAGALSSGLSSLFGGGQGARANVAYTLMDAMAFVAPALDRLRTAADGEINNRLNDAAMAMAHFGEQFWSRDAAERQLYAALDATVYDGKTWHAADTIASAYGASAARGAAGDPECWSASLLAEWTAQPGGVAGDAEVAALLAEMLPPSVLAERDPPRYMIKGLLSYDSEVWLIGGPGSKKSFVALDMAAHVALGRQWQGHKVNGGVSLLIMGEGAGSIGKRIKAWQAEYGPMPDDAIHILPRPVQAGDPRAWSVLVAAVAKLRAGINPSMGMFIVVDTQARSTVGLDENSAEQMGVYVNALAALRAASGGCVMSVHHTTKAGSSTRGSGAQDGAQYSRLLMKSEKGSLVSKLISDKQKDLEEEEPIELHFKKVAVGIDQDGEPVDSLVLVPRDAWTAGQVDDATMVNAEREAQREINPFAVRAAPEDWTGRLVHPNAKIDRWFLQALADVAQERGLTKAEWRTQVADKLYGKTYAATKLNWESNFQRLTDSTGDVGATGIVVKVHGADRWTVDRVALEAFLLKSD